MISVSLYNKFLVSAFFNNNNNKIAINDPKLALQGLNQLFGNKAGRTLTVSLKGYRRISNDL